MKNEFSQIFPQFDDAVPERFLEVGVNDEKKMLHIHHGAGTPSPYIVKLSRDEAPRFVSPQTVAQEIEQLAKSLIIDGDGDEEVFDADRSNVPLSELGVGMEDVIGQLQEFDSVVPEIMVIEAAKTPEHIQSSVSLDDALRGFVEGPVSLDAFVPLEATVDEAVLEQMHEDDGLVDNRKSTSLSDGELYWNRSVAQLAQGGNPPIAQAKRPLNRFFTFEAKVFQHNAFRALASFVALSFVVVLPLHAMQTISGSVSQVGKVQDIGVAALDDISRATSALSAKDFGAAQTDFSSAAAKFSDAQNSLNDLHAGVVALVNVIPQTERTYTTVRGLVTAGQELSRTASIISEAGSDVTSQLSTDVVTKLNVLSAYVDNALPHALTAQSALAKVDTSVVPVQYVEKVAKLQSETPALVASMQEFLKFVHTLTFLLGSESTMRYLALFQNNTELRPTGGFVGSFAEIDMDNGAMMNLTLPGGGTYDVQGQLNQFVASPEPLSLIDPRWEFQDGNWFPDFPTSAKKMQWFYEHAGGPTTDGVLAVNATFLEKVLEVIGSVEMPEYGVTVDAENFLFTTEKAVEIDADPIKNTPKAFLGTLAPKILEKVKSADMKTLLKLLTVVEQGLSEKDIQVYFRDNDAQKKMEELGFAGEMKQTNGDYLMVVNTNIGGGKTDAIIDQAIDQEVRITDSGMVTDALTITKTHRGMANALFEGKNNVDYMRVYVPEGSILLSADGFEPPADVLFEPSDVPLTQDDDLSIVMSKKTHDAATGMDVWNEFGKTVFGGWVQTAPGETQVIHVSYRIPTVLFAKDADTSVLARVRRQLGFDNHDGYSLLVQKQSGVVSRTTTVRVVPSDSLKTLWTNIDGNNSSTTTVKNDHDAFLGWIFTR